MHKIKQNKNLKITNSKKKNHKFIRKKNQKLTKQRFFTQNRKSNIKNKKPKIPNAKKEPQTHKKQFFIQNRSTNTNNKTIDNQIMKNSMKHEPWQAKQGSP